MRQRVMNSHNARSAKLGKKSVVELSAGDAFLLGATSKAGAYTRPLFSST